MEHFYEKYPFSFGGLVGLVLVLILALATDLMAGDSAPKIGNQDVVHLSDTGDTLGVYKLVTVRALQGGQIVLESAQTHAVLSGGVIIATRR